MTLRTIVDCDHPKGCNRAEIIGPNIDVKRKLLGRDWITYLTPKAVWKHYCPDHHPKAKQ